MRDSGKYFACFRVISFVSVPYFSVDHFDTCSFVILWSTDRKWCSEHMGGIRFEKFNIAGFSPLVLKSNIFEKKMLQKERNTSELSI